MSDVPLASLLQAIQPEIPLASLDQFERAAQRRRQTERPEGGRQPGYATQFATNAVPATAAVAGLIGQGLWDTVSYPKRLLTGETPYDWGRGDESMGHVFNIATGMAGSRLPFAKPGELGTFGGKATALPMDEASVAARAKQGGYPEQPFWRGEADGKLPDEYKAGGYFSRDKEYSDGIARRAGLPEAREFRLNLDKAFKVGNELPASEYARLVSSAEPNLARELVELIAPGKDAAWFQGFAKNNPGTVVVDRSGTRSIYDMINNSADPVGTFKRAGYDAIDSGRRDVRKLEGDGIRLKDAVFDPARAHEQNIKAVSGLPIPGTLLPLPRDSQFERALATGRGA